MSSVGIEEQAAMWLLRREQPNWSSSDQDALDRWLAESFAHKAAYWRLEHGWRMMDRIGALGLEPIASQPVPQRWWSNWTPAAVAASFVAAFVAGMIYLQTARETPVPQVRFSTAVGKQSTVPLADGSKLELNTGTEVRVALASGKREIWLDRGEAYFEVKHRADTPFVVHAGSRTVTVLGTKFAVRRDGAKLRLAVVEGRVRMNEATGGDQGPSAVVSAGNIAFADGNSTLVASRSVDQIQNELGWRDGTLVFDHMTLGQAAAEFNRYNRTQLIVTDPALASIRIGGTFRTSNADGFAQLLARAYGLHIERNSDKIIISQ